MPYFDGVKISVIPDPSVQMANLRAGQIDSLPVEKSIYNLLKDDPSLKVFVIPGNHTMRLRFNHVKGPCQDIRVRQAISYALDRKALITGTQFGLGRIASCIFPEDHWCHNPQLKPVSYDPEKSKKLLTEAGYPNALIEAGKNETDLAKRQKVYFELEKVLYDNYEDAWIWWELSIVAFRNTVMGYDNERHIKYREGYDLTHPLWFKDGKP